MKVTVTIVFDDGEEDDDPNGDQVFDEQERLEDEKASGERPVSPRDVADYNTFGDSPDGYDTLRSHLMYHSDKAEFSDYSHRTWVGLVREHRALHAEAGTPDHVPTALADYVPLADLQGGGFVLRDHLRNAHKAEFTSMNTFGELADIHRRHHAHSADGGDHVPGFPIQPGFHLEPSDEGLPT